MRKLNKTITRLTQIVGDDNIRTAPEVTAQHAVGGVSPGVVVFPGDMEQVAEVVRLANKERLTIFPWGSGSKTSGGTPPKQLDLVVCMSRLNTIIDMDTANLTVTVQAGVKFKDVQMGLSSRENRCYLPITKDAQDGDALFCSERNRTGCFLPLDPPSFDTATIGGIIAGNSTGPRRLLYGLPRDLVLGVRFVGPNGEIIGAGGKTVKNVSGYDISKLMIGSYGSLGILCEMTLRLLPLPERMETRLFSFSSFTHASVFVTRMLESNLLPAAVELINSDAIEQLPFPDPSQFAPEEHGEGYGVAVALEDFRESVERMKSEMTEMVSDLTHKGETDLEEKEHSTFWAAISNTDRFLSKRFSGLITAKISYPLSEWKSLIPFTDKTLSGLGTGHVLQAHAGSGVCRISLLTDNPNKETLEKTIQALGKISEHCSRVGGTLFITRAPASLRKHFSVWAKPGPELLVMKRIKEHLDPSGVMCPAPFMGDL